MILVPGYHRERVQERATVPRGRHAPPLEVRQDRQRGAPVRGRRGRVRPRRLRRRDRRGDRARGRHVEGDVLRALRQQGGLHRRALRRRDRGRPRRRCATRRRRTRGDRPARRACARRSARVPRDARRLPRRGADAAGGDRRRRARARWSAATARSTRVADVHRTSVNRAGRRARRRAAARLAATTRSRSSAPSSSSPRASSAPACPATSASSSRSSSGSCLGLLAAGAARVSAPRGARARRSSTAAAARGSSRGASRSRARSARRSATGTYWGRPIPGFGDPAARVLLLGLAPAAHGGNRTGRDLHRRPLGRLPVRRAAPRRASPTSRRRSHRDDGLRAARLPHHRRGALRAAGQQAAAGGARRTARRGWSASSRCSRAPRVVVCLGGVRVGGRRCAHARRCAAARPPFGHGARRPRRRAVAAARLLPPEPAEHVHRQADAGDAGRGARARARAGLGRVRRYARDPARAARGARWSPRRCSRASRSGSTRSRSSSTCASRPARSRSPARWRARSPPAPGSARRSRAGSSTAFGRAACCVPLAFVHAAALGALVGLDRARRADRRAARRAASSPASRSRRPRRCCARCGRPAARRRELLPGRLRARLGADRADLHHRPAADRALIATVRRPPAALIVSAVSVDRRHGRSFTALPPTRALRAATASAAGRRCSARSPRPACARSCSPRCRPASGSGSARSASRRSAAPRAPPRRPACCSRSGRSAARVGGLLYGALPRRAAAATACTCWSPRCCRSALLPLAAAPSVAGDGAARDPGRAVHRAAAGDPQRAGRRVAPRGRAHRGLHLAGHRVRRRDRGRLGAGRRARRGPGLADRVPRRRRASRRRRRRRSPSRAAPRRWSPAERQSDAVVVPLRESMAGSARSASPRRSASGSSGRSRRRRAAQAQAWPAIATGEHVLISRADRLGQDAGRVPVGARPPRRRADARAARGSSTSRR